MPRGNRHSCERIGKMRSEPPRVSLVSLGCAKNLVDSEKILAQLAEVGCLIAADPADADVIVVNTCGFLQAAKAEAIETLAALQRLKARDPAKRIVVAGCLVQREQRRLYEDVPYVDALVGVHGRDRIAETVRRILGASRCRRPGPIAELPALDPAADWSDRGRLRLTPRHYAYLRISEGCDQHCTFCTIPAIRGPLRSKRPDEVLAEAAELVRDGAFELVLIGQDTTAYGRDIGYGPGLAGLLRELDRLAGVGWIRLMYTYPRAFDEAVIEALAECERVVKYVDIPLQHVNDRILRRMGRRTTRRQIERLLDRLRSAVPGIAIRTTFIVGFPGESETEFAELLAFVQQQRFEAVGAFAFSREPGTPAARMRRQLDESVKQRRLERLMLAQQDIAFQAAREKAGREFCVLVDAPAQRAGWYKARHSGQAPEVDGVTLVRSRRRLEPGRRLKVRCIGSEGYDLVAEPLPRAGK